MQSGRKALQGAKTPKAQAAAAKQLSSAYKSASSTLSKAEVSPADAAANQELVSALKQTGDAYGKLASAASSGNKGAYTQASRKVQTSEAAVARALQTIQAAGYKIAGG